MAAANNSRNLSPLPTKFTVRSSEHHEARFLTMVMGIMLVLGSLFFLDPFVKKEIWWCLGGLTIAFLALETSSYHRDIELSVSIYPVGVQRTTQINSKVTDHPLLPRESIQDCILIEHVSSWSVSTQIVFRLKSSSSLVPAFPNAQLTFSQCHSLKNQIQKALNET